MIVRDFQKIIGEESTQQIIEMEGKLPDLCVACVGGGSNSMGLFYPFLEKENVKLIGVEAAGLGIDTNKHGASLTKGSTGILHGMMSYLLHDNDGQVTEAHSISAGLDYPGVGCEHSYLKDSGRANYVTINDAEALEGFKLLSHMEGIIPALEPAHALAFLIKYKKNLTKNTIVVMNMCGRGDKDIFAISKNLGVDL